MTFHNLISTYDFSCKLANMKIAIIAAMCTLLMTSFPTYAAKTFSSLESPNGALSVSFSFDEKLDPYPDGSYFYYAVTYKGQKLLLDSPIALDFAEQAPLAENLELLEQTQRSSNTQWQRVWGKSKTVNDLYNETTLTLRERASPKRKIEFIFRAYNDGIAFRYHIPEQKLLNHFVLSNERSYFVFPDNHKVWATDWPGMVSSQEEHFLAQTLIDLKKHRVTGTPLLIEAAHNRWLAIYEAALSDWAGMTLSANSNIANAVVTRLSPRHDNPDVAVVAQSQRSSPWRVIAVGEAPGELIESNLMHNLNVPNALTDSSWIEPGISAWDWWWSGSYAPDVDFEVGSNTDTMKYFIDFAAEMGWTYQIIDWQWYGPPFITTKASDFTSNPDADITAQNPNIDIPFLVNYAKSKGVKIILWLEWQQLDKQMDEAFALYEKWGVAGVKIDFMNRNDQGMVNYYHRVVKKAAEHKLVVNFHGAYMPTGIDRTYPNFITREGVLGNEYNKWSAKVTPEHCVTLPFTRMLGGHMDFTPGGFLNVKPENFEIQHGPAPQVMGTRAFQLAMFIVYESALTVASDSPYNYRNSPDGLTLLQNLPTTWDETRVLDGYPGDFIVIARRSGDHWYLAAMNAGEAKQLQLDLDFLAVGEYEAQVYADSKSELKKLTNTTTVVSNAKKFTMPLAQNGGQVVLIHPRR